MSFELSSTPSTHLGSHPSSDADGRCAALRVRLFRGMEDQGVVTKSLRHAVRIGRQADLDIVLAGLTVSRVHAEIVATPSGPLVRDLGSFSGIQVNGRSVKEHGPLRSSDEVGIAGWRLVVEDPPAAAPGLSFLDNEEIPAEVLADLVRELRTALDATRRDWAGMSDKALRAECAVLALRILSARNAVAVDHRPAWMDRMVAEVVGFGPLESLLRNPEVTEIMVNGPGSIFVESSGVCQRTPFSFESPFALRRVIERMFSPLGRRIDDAMPMADGRLADGSRINAVLSPPAVSGPSLTIRKFQPHQLTLDDLDRGGSMTPAMSSYLRSSVEGKKNVVVSGGTGSGKTTLLRSLAMCIPASERLITVEDAAELHLQAHNLVSLESREANAEGEGRITIRDLVRNALRMRPDRIIVGECRGGEALDMLQAMNTGHEGSLTTVHANNPRDVLARLEVMVMMAGFDLPSQAVREQIASAIDVIVHQRRFPDGRRRVSDIVEVCGLESGTIQTQSIFAWDRLSNGYIQSEWGRA